MSILACTKKDFITVLRNVKRQKREREKQLQQEWAELQKRVMPEMLYENSTEE